jgi:hypothetical protein
MWASEHLTAPHQLTLGTSAVAYEVMRIRVVAPLQQSRNNCADPLGCLRRSLKTQAIKPHDIFESVSG